IIDVDTELAIGLASPRDRAAMERLLYVEMVRHDGLAELAFTWAPDLARGQLELWRAATPDAPIELRRVSFDGKKWVGEIGHMMAGAQIKWTRGAETPQKDPTANPTYTTPTRKGWIGESAISDLAYAQRDWMLPEPSRRRIVTVQRALTDQSGEVIGVVRAGVLSEYLDQLVHQRVTESDPN